MKKLIVLLALLLPLLALSQEQEIDGTWKFHPSFLLSQASDMIDTEHHVYALANGALVELDKTSGQVRTLSHLNGLSDTKVKNIYYNYDKRYLMVVYSSSNIDLVYEDGRIVNISDLADVVMNASRVIKDVTFSPGKAWLATGFGLAVLDDEAMRVTEFRTYGTEFTSLAQVGQWLIACSGSKLYATQGARESLGDFSLQGISLAAARVRAATDTTFFLLGTNALNLCKLNEKNDWVVDSTLVALTPNNLQPTAGGWLANFRADKCYYTIANNESLTLTKVDGNNTSLFSCSPDADGTVWQIDANGIHEKGKTVYYKPDGMYLRSATTRLWYCMYNTWDKNFYVTSGDQKNNQLIGNSNWIKHVLAYDGNQWVDATPSALRSTNRMAKIAFIPGMANSYFLSDRGAIIYRVVDGVVNGQLRASNVNAPLHYPTTSNGIVCWEPALLVDNDCNLWMMGTDGGGNNTYKVVAMLPKEKLLADTINVDDWYTYDYSLFKPSHAQRQSIVCSTTGEKVYVSGYVEDQINVWRLNPATNDPHDIQVFHSDKFIDQNGRAIDWHLREVHVLAADSTGNVWVGSAQGVFYFKTDEVFNPDFRVTTPVAVEGEVSPYDLRVTSIAADPSNRKWIGTFDNGLFVVSPDGSKVLKHYDTDNSALPSSFVHEVAASADRAVVVTENGIVELDMGDVASATDYTAVTAAPTFVEPGYTGYVTIGQVDVGACVRITDRDGNIVREFTATSNQVAWDTCLENGERVPTGVYNIYAGLSADQLPGTPQVRVKIIK